MREQCPDAVIQGSESVKEMWPSMSLPNDQDRSGVKLKEPLGLHLQNDLSIPKYSLPNVKVNQVRTLTEKGLASLHSGVTLSGLFFPQKNVRGTVSFWTSSHFAGRMKMARKSSIEGTCSRHCNSQTIMMDGWRTIETAERLCMSSTTSKDL